MKIIIRNMSDLSIYEQIKKQIENLILTKKLKKDDMLPSIRALAKDVKTSIITVKRAYKELEIENFIYSTPGKGFYVREINMSQIRKEKMKSINSKLEIIVDDAINSNIKPDDLIKSITKIYKEKKEV